MLNSPLPDINLNCLSRGFSLDLPNIEVTSLDISSTGCYILAGCSNGMVILFDMTSSDRYYNYYLSNSYYNFLSYSY